MPATKLQSGSTLLVEGPASIRLVEGTAHCFGAPLRPGEWVIVKRERRVPVESADGCLLEIRLGDGGTTQELRGVSTIPSPWKEASQILRQALGVVAIVGEVDSGKSSLCLYLANECCLNGLNVNVIDADIGQADIGPPTTVTGATLKEVVYCLRDLEPNAGFFVGDISPAIVTDKVSRGASLVRSKLPSSDVMIVNTDGWIEGDDALRYKARLLDTLAPSMVVGVGDGISLDRLLETQRCTVLKLGRSEYARQRTREERKRAREEGYKRFLQGSRRREFKLDSLIIRQFNSSNPIPKPVTPTVRGVLAGLLDRDGSLLSVCQVKGVTGRRLTLSTRLVDDVNPTVLELGAIVLSPEYKEIGFV